MARDLTDLQSCVSQTAKTQAKIAELQVRMIITCANKIIEKLGGGSAEASYLANRYADELQAIAEGKDGE